MKVRSSGSCWSSRAQPQLGVWSHRSVAELLIQVLERCWLNAAKAEAERFLVRSIYRQEARAVVYLSSWLVTLK